MVLKKQHTSFLWFLREDKEYLIENVGLLLASGMDIVSALHIIQSGIRHGRMKKIISRIQTEIESGTPLWRALEQESLFPHYVTSLIRVGEATGRLVPNLQTVVTQQQRERLFHSKIKSAMMYPVLVLFITTVVGTGIAWFILPRLTTVFDQLHLQLPLITRVLLATGKFLDLNGVWFVPLLFGSLALIFYFLFLYSKTRFIGEHITLSLPGIGRLAKEVELARFGFMLGGVLETGLPILEALQLTEETTDVHVYKKLYSFLRNRMEEGNTFQKSFVLYPHTEKLIPLPLQQLIIAGEQSGKLSDVLLKIGAANESKSELTVKNLTVLLEPFLLVIVWLGVVFVALGVILPIYNLIGGLNV
jgi:type II secretory pathway component PulF